MPGILKPLFRWSFWFEAAPSPFSGWSGEMVFWFMLGLAVIGFALFLLASFAHKSAFLRSRLEKVHRQIIRRISGLLVTAGVFGLVWYWFTQARVGVFGMRAFGIVWLIIFAIWAWYLGRAICEEMKERVKQEARKPYEKWLPKPKK